MTIIIPTWVLWLLAVPAAAIVVTLIILGILFIWIFKDGFKINW